LCFYIYQKTSKALKESASLTDFFFPFTKLEIGFGFGITLRTDDAQNQD